MQIPDELKKLPNWVAYTLPGKIPMSPKTGVAAQSNDKTTWGTFDEAQKLALERDLAGVGFMFDSPYIGIDLDDCVVDGQINDFAKNILRKCNSYAELSPSGTGIHIIVRGQIPRAIKTPTLEVYSEKRYFTVTGKVIRPHTAIRVVDLSWLYPNETQSKVIQPFEQRLSSITEGNRNNTFASLAGTLRNRGFNDKEMFELLKAKAKETNFPEAELWTICQSVGRYPYVPASQGTDDTRASSIEEFLKEEKKVEWLVPGIIAKNTIGFVVGLPESRKTWLLIDLAVEAARGGVWLGKFPVAKSKVLFVDQERFRGETQRRFRSVLSAKGSASYVITGNLFIQCGTSTRLNLQQSFEAFRSELSELKPDLVVIDSFATFHTASENSRQEIQEVLEKVKQLRNEFGCTFIFIHHENKYAFNIGDEQAEPSIAQMSGSVAIPAVAEFVLTVRKQDSDSSMVYNTKNTMASTIAPFVVKVSDKTDDKSQVEVKAY